MLLLWPCPTRNCNSATESVKHSAFFFFFFEASNMSSTWNKIWLPHGEVNLAILAHIFCKNIVGLSYYPYGSRVGATFSDLKPKVTVRVDRYCKELHCSCYRQWSASYDPSDHTWIFFLVGFVTLTSGVYACISIIVWSEAPRWGRGGFIGSFVCVVNIVQDMLRHQASLM